MEVAEHFNEGDHSIHNVKVVGLEKVWKNRLMPTCERTEVDGFVRNMPRFSSAQQKKRPK